MSTDLATAAIGALLTIMYMVGGIGLARAVSAWKREPFRLVLVFGWPIALGVIAASGDIA